MKKILFLLMALSACTFQTKHRGYVFPPDLEEQIADIKTTSALVEKIGAPQAKTVYGDTVWIYYGVDENYRGPLVPTFTDDIVLLAWVRGNSVVQTRVLHDADLPDIRIADGETEIPAAIRSIIR